MPKFTYQTELAATFKKCERTIIGADGISAPGYIAVNKKGDDIVINLNTAKLPHGELAGPGLKVLEKELRQQFGKEAVKLEQTGGGDTALSVPEAYNLSVTIPDTHDALTALSRVHRDMAIYHCKTVLDGKIEDQLDYLSTQLGDKQAAQAFETISGVTMRYGEIQVA